MLFEFPGSGKIIPGQKQAVEVYNEQLKDRRRKPMGI